MLGRAVDAVFYGSSWGRQGRDLMDPRLDLGVKSLAVLDTLLGYMVESQSGDSHRMPTPTPASGGGQDVHARQGDSIWRSAIQATLHCLTGCAIGEVLGMVIATAFGWGNAVSIAVSVVLAFFFGYALTLRPVIAAGVPIRRALRVTLASDTVSIATMEIVDNAFILIVPGAIAAGLADGLFWGASRSA